jgi:hypothetical protein
MDIFMEKFKLRSMKRFLGIAVGLFFCFAGIGQELAPVVIASSGQDLVNGEKRIAFTVGELVVTTVNGGNYTLTQGFHQPPSLYFTDINKNKDAEISINVFPNPTKDIVNISIRSADFPGSCEVLVFNLYGQTITTNFRRQSMDHGENISIDLSNQAHGAYFIRVFDPVNQKQYTDFKVIKLR